MSKPHVIIIMADQLRYDAIGPHTPHIASLLQESVVFDRAYCASPLCVPARGAFFTGRYPNETGCLINPWEAQERNHGYVRSGTAHLYGRMEEEWDSWHTGKQHFLHEDAPDKMPDARTKWLSMEGSYEAYLKQAGKRKPGGERFKGIVPEMAFGHTTRAKKYSIPMTGVYEEGFPYFFDGYIADCSMRALRERDPSKPFLLQAMFLAPHPPLDVPEPWYSRVSACELPDNVGVWSEHQSPLQLYNLTGAVGTRYTREDWAKIWPVYLGLVSLLDDCVGMLIDELKRQGIYEETMILFTSDHGEMLGSHCLWQKMCMYEESVRIPLSLKFPSSMEIDPHHITAPVSSIDVFPTLCEALELEAPAGLSGSSLMPLIRGETSPSQNIFIQYDGNGARGNFGRCVVNESYKLIVDLFKDELYLELYAVGEDPQEKRNLIFDPDMEQEAERLLTALRAHMRSTGDLLSLPDDAYSAFVRRYASFAGDGTGLDSVTP
ncbi:sulfatase-like hydrolase/transferase [Paenibacillus sp. 1P07SE]|uniref:sulfatase-like hydrolase/transferase n=1 Tax=Paenibacillus sp. 1P07SE TaxID=3132209 RepID=UPI0039A57500